MIIKLTAEYVLFLKTVTFTKSLNNVSKDFGIAIVLCSIGAVLLYRIFYLYDNRRITVLREKNGIPQFATLVFNIFDLGVEVIKWLIFSFLLTFLILFLV